MLDVNALWKKAELTANLLSTDEIKALLDDRLRFVTARLNTASQNSEKEKLFDLIMLAVDSLAEYRNTIVNSFETIKITPKLARESRKIILGEIDLWHETLNLRWKIGASVQNGLFLGALIYAAGLWINDSSADSAKVMAKIDELLNWIGDLKSRLTRFSNE